MSEVLEVHVLAGFYEDQGDLVGEGRYTKHLDEDTHGDAGPPSETQAFRVLVPPRLRGRAVAAAVGVPVLLNE